jgi:hypothetical protein
MTTKPPPLDDPRWVPLNEAFERGQRQTGSDKLALADLRKLVQRAYTKRRSYDKYSGTTSEELLTPQFWRDHQIGRWVRGVRVGPRVGQPFPDTTVIYIWGPDLEEIWPPAAPPPAAPASERPTDPVQPPLRQRPGTKYKDDWPEVAAQKLIYWALHDPTCLRTSTGWSRT